MNVEEHAMKQLILAGAVAAGALLGSTALAQDSTGMTGSQDQAGQMQQGTTGMTSQSDSMTGQSGSMTTGSDSMAGGLSSDQVRQIQEALNEQGYRVGTVDGQMGPQTKQALEKFQEAEGLQATGELDSETLAALGMDDIQSGTGQAGMDIGAEPEVGLDRDSGAATSGSGMTQEPATPPTTGGAGGGQ